MSQELFISLRVYPCSPPSQSKLPEAFPALGREVPIVEHSMNFPLDIMEPEGPYAIAMWSSAGLEQ